MSHARSPVVAATDFVRAYPDLIREWVPQRYTVLGTDGFGRSDTRAGLRDFFEIDERYITVSALGSLAHQGQLDSDIPAKAIERLGIDPNKPAPLEH